MQHDYVYKKIRMMLGSSWHGKNHVRVAKVFRANNGTHDFMELDVRIELEGGTGPSFTRGDNRMVVATDTCKNHVYIVAKQHSARTPEDFAVALARSFLDEYEHVKVVRISVVEKPWTRLGHQGKCLIEVRSFIGEFCSTKLTEKMFGCIPILR